MGTVFLGPPRNERTANSCRLSQAKSRVLVLTVSEISNPGDEFLNDLRDRMGQMSVYDSNRNKPRLFQNYIR